MPTLEIITIGTELLLGEIADTNSTYIARTLRDHGIDIYRITTIGDNPGRITSTIKEAMLRAEIIITTGGLGPTVDDPTRQAVADAVNRDLIFDPDLWEQIKERFRDYGRQPTENNRQQAYIPKDAIPIHNPVGTAPCFIVEVGASCIISLPGVPREMETILQKAVIPYLCKKFNLQSQIIKATVLHAASMGESTIDELIADLERLSNPTVGLLAHPGQVDIRVTAKAKSGQEALELTLPIISELQSRLGDHIYGKDNDTLEGVIHRMLSQKGLSIAIIENDPHAWVTARLNTSKANSIPSQTLLIAPSDPAEVIEQVQNFRKQAGADLAAGFFLNINEKVSSIFVYVDESNTITKSQRYGGPKEYATLWHENLALDFLRRQLNQYWFSKIGES